MLASWIHKSKNLYHFYLQVVNCLTRYSKRARRKIRSHGHWERAHIICHWNANLRSRHALRLGKDDNAVGNVCPVATRATNLGGAIYTCIDVDCLEPG
jgi:hypothetical protein